MKLHTGLCCPQKLSSPNNDGQPKETKHSTLAHDLGTTLFIIRTRKNTTRSIIDRLKQE